MTLEQFEQAKALVPSIKNMEREIEHIEEGRCSIGLWVANSTRSIPDELESEIRNLILTYHKNILNDLQQKLSMI